VAEKKALGIRAAEKLAAKEGREPCPVRSEGRELAKTFWGKKWCENLDRYSSIANRLPRGQAYLRNGSVADLVIESGRVRAIVGGSEAYTVSIQIGTLSRGAWKSIQKDCATGIETLFELLQGRFSTQVMTRLTQARGGLFPEPGEISMSCSCPDAAGVCKHIAAVFYGVAVRLDQQPELLFRLRNVDHMELIGRAGTAAALDEALGTSSKEEFADGDLSSIFGIELELGDVVSEVTETVGARGAKAGKKASGRAVSKVAGKAAGKKAAPEKAAPEKAAKAVKTPVKKSVKKSVKKASENLAKEILQKEATTAKQRAAKKVAKKVSTKAAGKGRGRGRLDV
jgi:uncharacterized Zn finger protein